MSDNKTFTYRDRGGNPINVSEEHIETAIRLKIELQNLSPSGICSWAKHKRMMERLGFHDSDSTEPYRQLIKREQKNRGMLPTAVAYTNLVADKKIERLEALVGEMYVNNRERQNINRELNRSKRSIADEMLVIKDLKNQISEINFSKLPKVNSISVSNNEMSCLMTPSDWHIGLVTPSGLDYQVAERRVLKYTAETIRWCKTFGVDKVYVANLGDIINHIYMHKNTQAYNSEFDVATQMSKATKLMFTMLLELSKHVHVTYLGTIIGNHGRMSAKGETLTNDNVEVVINEMIKEFIELSNNENITYLKENSEQHSYNKSYVFTEIHGKNILMVHGDKETKNGSDTIKKHSSILGKNIDMVVQGHRHSFKVESENYERRIVTSGSLMGSDDYAEGLGLYTGASQLISFISATDNIQISIDLNDIS